MSINEIMSQHIIKTEQIQINENNVDKTVQNFSEQTVSDGKDQSSTFNFDYDHKSRKNPSK